MLADCLIHRGPILAACMFRGEFALCDIVSHTRRIAFCRVAPASGSAEDVLKYVASPDRKSTLRWQFAHLAVAPEQVH